MAITIEFLLLFALQNVVSAYAPSPTLEQINQTLAVIEPRVIDNGHCIKYKNKTYIPTDANDEPQYLRPKTKCLVTKTLDNNLYINANDNLYLAKLIPISSEYSTNFDEAPKAKLKEKKKYIPPMSHPWKYTHDPSKGLLFSVKRSEYKYENIFN